MLNKPKLIKTFPKGTKVVGMTVFDETLVIATETTVYRLRLGRDELEVFIGIEPPDPTQCKTLEANVSSERHRNE